MEPTTVQAIKGIDMFGEFYEDIKQEWELCTTANETLETLSVTDTALYWCLENGKTYPNLKEITVSFIGRLTVDYIHGKTESNWCSVEQSIRSLQLWLHENTFPTLKTIRIQWASYVGVITKDWGEIDGYDREGPKYDTDYTRENEYMNMDAVLNLYCSEWKDIDWSFLEAVGISSLHLPYMLYDVTDSAQYGFKVFCNTEYDEAAEEQVRSVLNEY